VISIENISMRYSTDNPLSLRDISGQIRAGRITAIIGPSGSGKSTLADIVAGLVSPSSGRVVVDDTVIDDANRRLWRSRIAIVPQDPFLFDTSISDNLKLAKPDASEEEMWTALGRAQIAAHIRRLPAGLNTRVGSRGARFSGGERQRIVIARALLPDPEILILDEATSALDDENQRLLASLIQTLRDDGLSILLIAHQSSLTDIADDIIRLDKGQIRSS
jgi:ATP-binding cassette subfamily C protein